MAFPMYQHTFTVTESGISPQGPLPCGTAGDDGAARLIFVFASSFADAAEYRYRLEIVCGDGSYDLTAAQVPVSGALTWEVPAAWTAAGTAAARLVQVATDAEGHEVRRRHFAPVLLQFAYRDEGSVAETTPRWQELLARGEQLLDVLSGVSERVETSAALAATEAAKAVEIGKEAEEAATSASLSAERAAEESRAAHAAAEQAEPQVRRAEQAADTADEKAQACDALLQKAEDLCGTVAEIEKLTDGSGIVYPCVTVDTVLNEASDNPVTNRAVATALNGKSGLSHSHTTADIPCANSGYWWGESGSVEDAFMSISNDLAHLNVGLDSFTARGITTEQPGGTVEESLAGLWGTKLSRSELSPTAIPFSYSGTNITNVAEALTLLLGKAGL